MARKEKKYHFIYKTTNTLTGYYYYGMHSTDNIDDGYLGSGRRLRYSINKYGQHIHKREIIEHLPNRKSLIAREIEIITLNEITKKECMNLMCGGRGGFISEEQQLKRAKAAGAASKSKRESDPLFEELIKEKISKSLKKSYENGERKVCTPSWVGRKHKEESKRKIGRNSSLKQRGNKNSQFGTCWITNEKENKKMYKGDLVPEGWRLGRKVKQQK